MTFVDVNIKVLMEMAVYLKTSAQVAELERNVLLLYPYILNQIISHGRAAEILGMHKMELIELYSRLGIPYIDMTDEEFEEEIQAVKRGVLLLN